LNIVIPRRLKSVIIFAYILDNLKKHFQELFAFSDCFLKYEVEKRKKERRRDFSHPLYIYVALLPAGLGSTRISPCMFGMWMWHV
jgi:hypothetical protein